MKTISGVYRAPGQHWVGDGFPVRSLFSYNDHGRLLSPFLLLDHAGPAHFEPAEKPRGVGEHPHRGFETVTLVYAGEVDHRDSSGGGGHIGPGDVQWMTAAAGVVHEEFHSPAFTRRGGELEMVQLWVNLPARDKMNPPRYQTLLKTQIPALALADGQATLRVIAGEYAGATGPAMTHTPLNVWDLRMQTGGELSLDVSAGHTLAVVVLHGDITLNDEEAVHDSEMAVFRREGESFRVRADSDSTLLILSGEPIDEPVVGYGPFVMNTREDIMQAISDFNNGDFGRLPTQ